MKGVFPAAKQVRQLGLEVASDMEIFEFAKSHGYTVVPFDLDFVDLNVVRGFRRKSSGLEQEN